MLASDAACQTRDKRSGMVVWLIHHPLPPSPPCTLPSDLLINILVGLRMASLGQGHHTEQLALLFFLCLVPISLYCHWFPSFSLLFSLSSFIPPPPLQLISSSSLMLLYFSPSLSLPPLSFFLLYARSSFSSSPSALSPLESAC